MKGLFTRFATIVLCIAFGFLSSAQTFVTNGSASSLGGGCYQLTPNSGGQAGTIFSTNTIDLTQEFTLECRMYFGNKDVNGADGIDFIFATSNTAVGVGGGGMGYQGITPSFAVEYDDYQNGNFNDPAQDHMAIISMGDVNHGTANNLAGPINIANIEDNEDHCFAVLWDPTTLTLTASLDGETIFYTGDIVSNIFSGNPNVYFGFSSGTGSLSNLHRVCVGPPLLDPMPDLTVCQGESAVLEADQNGIAWTWAPNPTLSQLDISDPTASPVITTTYRVTIEYPCDYFLMDTVVVTVIPEPNAIADNNGPACPASALQLFATGGSMYSWSGPGGYFSSQQNPVINPVTAGNAGIYTVTITDANGCTNTAETEVELYPLPFVEIDPFMNPLCEDGDALQLTGTPSGGDWSGAIDANGIFNPVQEGEGSYVITYTITDGNGCSNTDQVVVNVVPNVPAQIQPDGPFCISDPVITLTAVPPGGMWGESANSDGEIYPGVLGVGSHLVSYTLTGPSECYNTTFYVDIVDAPDVDITDIAPLCGDDMAQTLTASPAGGTWTGIAAPNGVVNPASVSPGTYQVIYEVTLSGGCAGRDTAMVTILPAAPQISGLQFDCDPTATMYTVTFTISNGDPATYSVTGNVSGSISGGPPYVFVSNAIPSGGAYSFTIDDINHCGPVTISGTYACNCGTQSGIPNLTPVVVCPGDTITILPPVGTMLDANDTLVYVLHRGDPNMPLVTGHPNQFVFGPPLAADSTYFVSVLAGDVVPGVGVDPNDPCRSVSPGVPVSWHASPFGALMLPAMICTGDSATLVFNLNGNGPFDIVWTDGSGTFHADSIVTGYSVIVKPAVATTYTLLQVHERMMPSCDSLVNTSAMIDVTTALSVMVNQTICEGDSLLVGGAFQHLPGVYSDTLTAVAGCDSIVLTTLAFLSADTTLVSTTTCDINQTGIFEMTFQNQDGCDSVVITSVGYIASDTSQLTSTTCNPAMAGVFTTTLTGQDGCDSVIIETVTLLPADTTYLNSTTCDPSMSGIFTQLLSATNGCDSLVIENVALLAGDTTMITNWSCFPADTGITMTLLQNANGCDSLILEMTQLAPSYLFNTTAETCLSSNAGVFVDSLTTTLGCDSVIVHTVILQPSDTIILSGLSCETLDTGLQILDLVNQFGCDSLVFIHTVLYPPDSCIEVVHDFYFPNVFSPNDDGINDAFYLQSPPHSVSHIDYLRIFDRWGNLVFDTRDILPNNPMAGWNGKYRDRLMNPDVFVWTVHLEFEDGVEGTYFGDVTIVR